MSEFYNMVERLTREHRVVVNTDDGVKFAKADGLLKQLRDAIFNSGDKGATAGNKAKLPINAPALDLLTLIDRQIAEVWGAVTGRIPNADRSEKLLTEWANAIQPEKLVTVSSPEMVNDVVIWTKAEHTPDALLSKWTRQIEELFDPPRTAPNPNACISCGEREVWRKRDGESVRQTALILIIDRETDKATSLRCQACGISWSADQFEWLNNAILENEERHAEKK